SLGHRRPLDERPPADRPADRLRLRRPLRRRGDQRARVRGVRGLGRGHGPDARRLPVRARLPVVRPEPEVREPQRAARQARRPDVPAPPCRFPDRAFVLEDEPTTEGGQMQYMLLIYDQESVWETMPEDEQQSVMREYFQYTEDLKSSGKYVAGDALQPIATAKSVRVRDGETSTTDGPFAETKEVLGGYYLIDVDTLDEALEWAVKLPGSSYGTVEVRPLVTN